MEFLAILQALRLIFHQLLHVELQSDSLTVLNFISDTSLRPFIYHSTLLDCRSLLSGSSQVTLHHIYREVNATVTTLPRKQQRCPVQLHILSSGRCLWGYFCIVIFKAMLVESLLHVATLFLLSFSTVLSYFCLMYLYILYAN